MFFGVVLVLLFMLVLATVGMALIANAIQSIKETLDEHKENTKL
jgi:multisubunit Na+/H+ antiporter MnhG subunit